MLSSWILWLWLSEAKDVDIYPKLRTRKVDYGLALCLIGSGTTSHAEWRHCQVHVVHQCSSMGGRAQCVSDVLFSFDWSTSLFVCFLLCQCYVCLEALQLRSRLVRSFVLSDDVTFCVVYVLACSVSVVVFCRGPTSTSAAQAARLPTATPATAPLRCESHHTVLHAQLNVTAFDAAWHFALVNNCKSVPAAQY